MIRLKLTSAQESALECRGLDWQLDAGERLLSRSWSGSWLEFGPEDREELASAICEASNAEDAASEEHAREGEKELARLARGAAVALGNLQLKVSRS